MALNWTCNDYFSLLLHRDKRAHAALEMLVDDLHTDKERTISRFLCHSGSEDFLWGLVRLLGNGNSRVAGNAAYILGTIAESELGCFRVISLTTSRHTESLRILPDLTNMLVFDDSESVMNAAGTMGTLAESHDGRMWMLSEKCLPLTVTYITRLLGNDNLWTASNAALVLARLTISEEGCERLLTHDESDFILGQLITSLGVDEAGRGMNAAFAIGRMCDMEQGRTRLLALQESEKMITALAWMLCCSDAGASKNACFALSCLATNKDGHTRLLKNCHSEEVLRTLSELLSSEDTETGWFAAMTLRTLASQPKGCLRLRDHSAVLPALKSAQANEEVVGDLREEVEQTLEILKRLEKPEPPNVEVSGMSAELSWDEVTTKCGFLVKYQIFEGSRCVFTGRELNFTMSPLEPFTTYTYRLRVYTEGDESPLSDPVSITTEETVPEPPQNLQLLGCTTTQLKVGWEEPEKCNGVLKGFYVYNGKNQVEFTTELCSIISGLQPNTSYEIHVCAANAKGKGSKETIQAMTTELGAHAPSKPDVIVRGRNELYVSWKPPEVPLGRITRYDLCMDGTVVYSGTDLHSTVRRLKPGTEYSFVVTAITSEGKCESKTTKKRTAKDEYEGDRAPLYQPPPKKDTDQEGKTDGPRPSAAQLGKKRRSLSGLPTEGAHPKSAISRTASASSYSKARQKEKAGDHTGDNSAPPSRKASLDAGVVKKGESLMRAGTKPSDGPSAVSPENVEAELLTPRAEPPKSSKPRASSAKSRSSHKGDTDHGPATKSGNPTQRTRSKTTEHYLKQNGLPFRPKRRLSRSMDLVEVDKSIGVRRHSLNPSYSSTEKLQVDPPRQRTESMTDLPEGRMPVIPITDDSIPNRPVAKSAGRTSPPMRRQQRRVPQRSSSWMKTEATQDVTAAVADTDAAEKTVTDVDSLGNGPMALARQTNRELTRVLSTITTGQYKPTASHVHPSNMLDFDCHGQLPGHLSPFGARGSLTGLAVHRSNTFMASHRPGLRRHLEKLASPKLTLAVGHSPSQWEPDLPVSMQNERQHNKFVPMQFRTQPAHIPGGFHRQVTNLALMEGSSPNLRIDLMSRTRNNDADLATKVMKPQLMEGPAAAIPAKYALDSPSPSGANKFALNKTRMHRDRLSSAGDIESQVSAANKSSAAHNRLHRSTSNLRMAVPFSSHNPSDNHKLQSAS